VSAFDLPLAGGCFCGRVRYRVTAPPLFAMACHCTDCQQMTASAFSLGLVVPREGFAVEVGAEPRAIVKQGTSGATSTRHVCPVCATWTHTETTGSPEVTVVRPSSLDDRAWVRPVAQIWTRSAHPWALMPLPFSFDREFDDPAPIAQVFAASDIRPGKVA